MDILKPHERDLGGGLMVSRVLPGAPYGRPHQTVGPFIFFDQMGPTTVPPDQNVDVRPHPHIGLATVTWLFEGGLVHRDSLGAVQPIAPGDVNWMTAGRGIAHSERQDPALRRSARPMFGIQAWVALPRDREDCPPAFTHHSASTLPAIRIPGAKIRLIAGTIFGEASPVPACSPLFYAAVEMDTGATLTLPADHEERGVYLVQGEILVSGQPLPPRHLAVVPGGGEFKVQARSASRLMLLGGEKLDGPRHIWWNFVASSADRLEAAKQRWRAREFPPIPGDETEFIPLPER